MAEQLILWSSDGVPLTLCISWKQRCPSSLEVVLEINRKNPAIRDVCAVGPKEIKIQVCLH